jgi:hypothetical protein
MVASIIDILRRRMVSAPTTGLWIVLLFKACNPCIRLEFLCARTGAQSPSPARFALPIGGSCRVSSSSSGYLPLLARTRICLSNVRQLLVTKEPAPSTLVSAAWGSVLVGRVAPAAPGYVLVGSSLGERRPRRTLVPQVPSGPLFGFWVTGSFGTNKGLDS